MTEQVFTNANMNDAIDGSAVVGACKSHKDLLKSVNTEKAQKYLQHLTPEPDIQDTRTLGELQGGKYSGKYDGVFTGTRESGKIVPRVLKVGEIKMEISQEPAKLRRTYIAKIHAGDIVAGKMPFEVDIVNNCIVKSSKELYKACGIGEEKEGKETEDCFDSLHVIIGKEKAAGNITEALGNMYPTGVMTRANIGDQLLAMYRKTPTEFKDQDDKKMHLANDLADMLDDWRKDEGQVIIGQTEETTGTKYLPGTNGELEIVRLTNLPTGSQMVFMTTKANARYGYDKKADFSTMKPVYVPYKFAAAGVYYFGMQFVSIHKNNLIVNDQPLYPVAG